MCLESELSVLCLFLSSRSSELLYIVDQSAMCRSVGGIPLGGSWPNRGTVISVEGFCRPNAFLSIVEEGDRDDCTVSCICLASALIISVCVDAGVTVRTLENVRPSLSVSGRGFCLYASRD